MGNIEGCIMFTPLLALYVNLQFYLAYVNISCTTQELESLVKADI